MITAHNGRSCSGLARCEPAPWWDPGDALHLKGLRRRSAPGPHADSHLCTCCRHYPGAAAGRRLALPPSHISLPRCPCRVGLHVGLFEACSAFTHVAACTRAQSLSRDRSIQRLQTFRLLHACSGCFRLERSPGGTCTHWKAPPFTAHGTRNYLRSCPPRYDRRVARPATTTGSLLATRAARPDILWSQRSLSARQIYPFSMRIGVERLERRAELLVRQ